MFFNTDAYKEMKELNFTRFCPTTPSCSSFSVFFGTLENNTQHLVIYLKFTTFLGQKINYLNNPRKGYTRTQFLVLHIIGNMSLLD